MSQKLSITEAQTIMQNNFIGPEELKKISLFRDTVGENVLEVPFTAKELESKKNDYLLLYGVPKLKDGRPVTIRNLINIYGKNPEEREPCFYNQDWYDKEKFIDSQMEEGWYLIREKVFEDSRAVQPNDLMKKYMFPSAISCVYAFFVTWLCKDVKLWYHDFVWCSDVDHNGDRIYVGKYNDTDGVNKNGFSIHRHLSLRDCYGCID